MGIDKSQAEKSTEVEKLELRLEKFTECLEANEKHINELNGMLKNLRTKVDNDLTKNIEEKIKTLNNKWIGQYKVNIAMLLSMMSKVPIFHKHLNIASKLQRKSIGCKINIF